MLQPVTTTEVLARALDVYALRQSVYSANIANASVDGYRRLEVKFDADSILTGTVQSNSALATAQPQVISTSSAVKLDEEMANLARNALQYQTLLGFYERSMNLLSAAVHEGKGA
jgi:flagellar basal-body rod protein FlgB